MKRIIRVFPRKTKATPDDPLAYVNCSPGLLAEADEVHISVAFSWDLLLAEKLAKKWKRVAPVEIGGPATGQRSEEFTPGKYIKHGYVITSRGCPNKCWFCTVWRREGLGVRELPIHDGFDVLDDNFLACSDKHIKAVFAMLRRQKQPIRFTGGLEAARLKDWHLGELLTLRLSTVYFAYDTPDDLEPLQRAGRMLKKAGLLKPNGVVFKCFVLSGFAKDTYGEAERRIRQTTKAGFVPYVMLYRGKDGEIRSGSWRVFRHRWSTLNMILWSICWEDRSYMFSGKE